MRQESLSDYADLLRRRAFSILLTALLVGGGTLAVGLRLPRTYSSSVVISVESRQQTPLSALPTLVQTALSGADPTQLQTLASRLTSMTLLESARRDLSKTEPEGAKRLPPLPILAKSVRASVETGSNLLSVSVDLREDEGGARNAALFANQLVETFRLRLAEESREDRQRDASAQLDLIRAKRNELVALLDATRSDLIAFARRKGNPTVWSAELSQRFGLVNALAQERRAAESESRRAEIEQRRADAALSAEPEMAVTAKSDASSALRARIEQELLTTNAESARRVGEGLAEASPERKGLAAAEAYLEQRKSATPPVDTTTTIGLNPRRDRLFDARHDSGVASEALGAELALLDATVREADFALRSGAARIPEDEIRLGILQRQAESLARLYDELLSRESEVELALGQAAMGGRIEGRKIGGVAVVDPALPEFRPVRPRPTYLLAAGATLGLLSGLSVGLASEWLSRRHESPKNEERPPDVSS